MRAGKSGCSPKKIDCSKKGIANERGAATGVLVHRLVTEMMVREGG